MFVLFWLSLSRLRILFSQKNIKLMTAANDNLMLHETKAFYLRESMMCLLGMYINLLGIQV